MPTTLHYSPLALVRRSAWMIVAAALVIADLFAHASGGALRVWGLSPMLSAAVAGGALYLVGVTAILTVGLMRHGGAALSAGADGLAIHTAWFTKTVAWPEIADVAIEVRYGKYSHHDVVAIREASGIVRVHTVDTRLLAEAPDQIAAWIDEATRERSARPGGNGAKGIALAA